MKTILKEIAKPVFALFFLANYANCVFAQNETFGPYITTQWSQYSPFNNEFPTINGTKVPAGCTTISTAQILNFYKHCNKLDLKGSHEIYAAVESPYFSNTKMEGNNFKFDYEYSYTPDFDNIDYDKNVEELSKFLFAISLAQSCYYDVDGSMTSYYVQFGCFQNIFGYDGEIHFREKDGLDFVVSEIKEGRPVIISDEARDHSYIIDGYRKMYDEEKKEEVEEIHVNLGWGDDQNDWYSINTIDPEKSAFISAYPTKEGTIKMQSVPKILYVKGMDNDYDQTFPMVPGYEGDMNYCNKDFVDLEPGKYSFYFEYPDGTTIAPILTDQEPLTVLHEDVISYSKYQKEPAIFTVGQKCSIKFWHNPEMGYIDVLGQNYIDLNHKDYNACVIMNNDTIPMIYDEQGQRYIYDIIWKPGQYEFCIYNSFYKRTIGFAESTSGAMLDVFYKIANDGTVHNHLGWRAFYNEGCLFPVDVKDYAEIDGNRYPASKTKCTIEFDRYGGVHVIINGFVQDNITIGPNNLPKKLHITGIDNNFSKTFDVKQISDQEYECEQFTLSSGKYSYYFELADGKKEAPMFNRNLLSVRYDQYSSFYFSTEPQKLELDYKCDVKFNYNSNTNSVNLKGSNFKISHWGEDIFSLIIGNDTIPMKYDGNKYYCDMPFTPGEYSFLIYNSNNKKNIGCWWDDWVYDISYGDENDQHAFSIVYNNESKNETFNIDVKDYAENNEEKIPTNKTWCRIELEETYTYFVNVKAFDYGEITSISIKDSPKTEYIQGEEFNPSNGTILVKRSDNESYEINLSDAEISRFDSQKVGEQELTISYMNCQTTLNVTVKAIANDEITEISIKSSPKTEYIQGEEFDPSNGVILVKRVDNDTYEINLSDAEISGFDSQKVGEQELTISYMNCQTTLNVTVKSQTAITDVEGDNLKIWGTGKTIYIENAKLEIYVYNCEGQIIKMILPQMDVEEISVSRRGLYVIRVGDLTRKIVL